MNLEKKELRASVREGYQILLRAHAELYLPAEKEQIARYYQALADKCMQWAIEVYGEELRREFLSLDTVREKSKFGTQQYLFRMRYPFEDSERVAVLCESKLLGQRHIPANSYHRLSQVWCLEEETILPNCQITDLYLSREEQKRIPFRPDGIYPEGKEVVIFKNATPSSSFMEERRALQMSNG